MRERYCNLKERFDSIHINYKKEKDGLREASNKEREEVKLSWKFRNQ